MTKHFKKFIWLLPAFVLLQVLVLNSVLFFRYINPYLYLILIISLPLKTPKWFLLSYAFVAGFLIDLFTGSLGFHSTATVFTAFIKPFVSKIVIPHNILGDSDEINLNKIGFKSFVTYSLIVILTHNTSLFVLEHLNFNGQILIKIIASSIITLLLILILELFKSSKNK